MEKRNFLKMVALMGKEELYDYTYELNGKRYGFQEIDEDDSWDDQGKYQYKTEKGQLVELDEDNYTVLQEFNYGVRRDVQRSGSYFSDYHYEYEDYEPFEIREVEIPEVIIPAHIERREFTLKIDKEILEEIELEQDKAYAEEQLREQREKEEESRKEELRKKYTMNDQSIIQRVAKKLRKDGNGFTIKDMQQEYFNIVEKENLKDEEWLDYHRKNTLNK